MKNNDLNQKTCKTCGAPISYRKQNFQLQKEGLNSQRSYSNGQAAIGNIYENHWHGEQLKMEIEQLELRIKAQKLKMELSAMEFMHREHLLNTFPSVLASKVTSEILGGVKEEIKSPA